MVASAQQSRRVTCVVNSLAPGGAERSMNWLAGSLASRGHQITLLTLKSPATDYYVVPHGVTRDVAPPTASQTCRWYNLFCTGQGLRSLRRAILRSNPEVVISFVDTLNVQVLLALLGIGVPVIASERIYPPSYRIGWRWNLLRRIAYPLARAVVMQTRLAADWARKQWPSWRVREIANAVASPTEESSGRPEWFGQRNVIALGRFAPQKNFPLLIAAFSKVAARNPGWHLSIVGDGPERPRLEALRDSLGMGNRLHMPGKLRSPWTILRQADLFVLSSNFEGFPNVLAEAMAHGLPVVSTDCPAGPSDLVRHGIDGILVPPNDVDALADALSRLMTDEAYRAALGRRAPEVCQRFAEVAICDEWWRLIDEVLAVG